MAKQSELFARYRSLVNSNSKAPGESVNSRRLNTFEINLKKTNPNNNIPANHKYCCIVLPK